MISAYVIQITTPKKFVLNGLWFGPKRPKRVIIWVHGLTSSAFSRIEIVEKLVDRDTAVLTFNNRGHNKIGKVLSLKGKSSYIGEAHEVFAECVDDIQGAIFSARKQGVKEIYLAGHSTGCQKSIYWAYKNNGGKAVKGVILLAPLSDYADTAKFDKKNLLPRAITVARKLVRQGKSHELLPLSVWPRMHDAQRFLSLYTPDSIEQSIFSYFDDRPSRILRSVRVPLLVLLAQNDEYRDRPMKKIVPWFNHEAHRIEAHIIPNVGHSFKGGEDRIAKAIQNWI